MAKNVARRAAAPPDGQVPSGSFDLNDLKPPNLGVMGLALEHPQWIFRILRRFFPIIKIPFTDIIIVTRFDDVQEVLDQQSIFQVPFDQRMEELNAGPNFVLGMQDGPKYRLYQQAIMQAFRLEDIDDIVAPMAASMSAAILAHSTGRLDAIRDLITAVPTSICERYFGLPIPDKVEFANWTLAMATYIFADPTDDPGYHRAAVAAGDRVRPLVDAAIDEARRGHVATNTVLARLTAPQGKTQNLTNEDIRSLLTGMITGFIPTNTLAGGHILEMLLDRRDCLGPTREAAQAGDDELLKRCLFEVMRLQPLNPGPFRVCRKDYVIANGTSRARQIKADTRVLACTQSAMLDPRFITNPNKFDPDRQPSDYSMVFGHGVHWCVGAFIAQAHLVGAFKSLLRKDGLRRAKGSAGQMQRIGPYPSHLIVEFQSEKKGGHHCTGGIP